MHPLRGVTSVNKRLIISPFSITIHAPLAECDPLEMIRGKDHIDITTHALLQSATLFLLIFKGALKITIHAPLRSATAAAAQPS